jgi:hypothetical protein
VEQLGAGSGTEGVEALAKSALELVGSHGRSISPPQRSTSPRRATPAYRVPAILRRNR